jgi:hypothetical protein
LKRHTGTVIGPQSDHSLILSAASLDESQQLAQE